MSKNKKTFIIVILLLFSINSIIFGWRIISQKKTKNFYKVQKVTQNVSNKEDNFRYDEVIINKIGVNGGIMQNTDKSVIVTIPSLEKETEFIVSFKRSNFEVRSGGTRSPLTISIYPDINLSEALSSTQELEPIRIRVKYDGEYNLPVPYLIDEKNKLHLVDFGELDRENNYFTMYTFHGGDYSWIYSKE